ncbi:MAG: fused MFS/spermidine synthase [Nitrospirae bacterium]|nr:fused MFS/spermidine synthase [Nitrospirota bacterium]
MTYKTHSLFLPVVFAVSLFMSASLLFIVEPMIAKMILPILGGTPAVWNTCMMFFQAALLAGYAYAHLISERLSFGRQVAVHIAILLIACIFLPVGISKAWIRFDVSPIWMVVSLLFMSVSLPFFVLSSSAPLLQRWFAATGHESANDPYFLYSASNLGSMLALLAYPTIIEPKLSLGGQSSIWTIGYILFALLTGLCAYFVRKNACINAGMPISEGDSAICIDTAIPPTMIQRFRWIVLAFIPSSLMLGVTTHFTTDIASIPLFWVVPLALYLLSFIIVFAKLPFSLHKIMVKLLPFGVATLLFLIFSYLKPPMLAVFMLHLGTFFAVAMVCHGELAASRPAVKYLTEFYLLMSVGGALGGVFNALVAPIVFKSILEYPLVLALAGLVLPYSALTQESGLKKYLDLIIPVLIGILAYWLMDKWPISDLDLSFFAKTFNVETGTLTTTLTYGIPALLCYAVSFIKKPARFGIAVMVFVGVWIATDKWGGDIIHRERSFFGVHTVINDADGRFRSLVHGTTLHGKQSRDPEYSQEPFTYFHRQSPIGQVFTEFSGKKAKDHIAVVGLGAGTLVIYGETGQKFTFYEIDPTVKNIAVNPEYFTFFEKSKPEWQIILGDGRLRIEEAQSKAYGIIILDAFSSDAIPVHLLTKEALKLYLSKLRDDGILAFQITNKYVSLEPVLQKLANDAGITALLQEDGYDMALMKYGSKWVLMARNTEAFGRLAHDERWRKLEGFAPARLWTDDFSNVLSFFNWE